MLKECECEHHWLKGRIHIYSPPSSIFVELSLISSVSPWGLFFLHTTDRLSCVRPRKSKHTKAIHNTIIHTNSATFGHRFDNIVDPTDKIWVSWYHRCCFDNLMLALPTKISHYKVWLFLTIQKHANYAYKTHNTKIQCQHYSIASQELHKWNLRKILVQKHTTRYHQRWSTPFWISASVSSFASFCTVKIDLCVPFFLAKVAIYIPGKQTSLWWLLSTRWESRLL